MIDLHLHTLLSDGRHTIEEILEMAAKANLNTIAITDHNHSLAFEQITPSIRNIFKGKILTGCEMATSYRGYIIEILGFGVDVNVINAWYRNYYSDERLKQNEEFLFNRLKDICKQNDLILSEDLKMEKIVKGISKKTIYRDLILHQENVDKYEMPTYGHFFRKYLSNPNHPLFLNEALTYPTLQETLDLIHKANGLAFLAHPCRYGLEDHMSFIQDMTKEYAFDGIECFHPSANLAQANELRAFCQENNLYPSGGSDFHAVEMNDTFAISTDGKMVEDELLQSWFQESLLFQMDYAQVK